MAVIEQFPPGARLILVGAGSDADTRRSFYHPFNTLEIPILVPDPALPNMNWFAAAKIQVAGRSIGKSSRSGGNEVFVDDELPRVSFWLNRAQTQDGTTTPCDVAWQLRCSSCCTPEVLENGSVSLKGGIEQVGMIAQASGYLGNGYELWMRVDEHVANAKVMLLDLEVRASRFHGGPREVWKGSVSI